MGLGRWKQLVVAVAFAGATTLACAAPMTYRYSYTFNDGTVIGGTLTGEANGDFVEDIADITLSVNGAWQSGPFYLYGWDTNNIYGWLPSLGRVSFDGSLNHLLFADQAPPLIGPSNYFYYLNNQDWCATDSCTLVSIQDPHFDASDVGAAASRWILEPCEPFPGGGSTTGCFPGPGPFPAPEPGTLALLGLGLAGLAAVRRRKQ